MFSSLRGKAKKAALQLEIKDLKVKGWVVQLKEKLDKAFSKNKKKTTCYAYEKFERLSVQALSWLYNRIWRTSLLSRTIWDKTSSCCTSISISQQCKPYRSPKYHCSDHHITLYYDNMVKQVKAVYRESKQKQTEEKIKIKVEDRGYEFEETFYSWETMKEIILGVKVRCEGSYRGKCKDNERKRGKRQKPHR